MYSFFVKYGLKGKKVKPIARLEVVHKVDKYFVSRVPLSNYQLVTGQEAVEKLREQGLKFIHVDDDGRIRALNKANSYLNGFYVYKKQEFVLDSE